MTWGPWLWYKAINVGSKSLEVCDYLGEHLASFFGITTPKYQYEIDEFNRIMEEVSSYSVMVSFKCSVII